MTFANRVCLSPNHHRPLLALLTFLAVVLMIIGLPPLISAEQMSEADCTTLANDIAKLARSQGEPKEVRNRCRELKEKCKDTHVSDCDLKKYSSPLEGSWTLTTPCTYKEPGKDAGKKEVELTVGGQMQIHEISGNFGTFAGDFLGTIDKLTEDDNITLVLHPRYRKDEDACPKCSGWVNLLVLTGKQTAPDRIEGIVTRQSGPDPNCGDGKFTMTR